MTIRATCWAQIILSAVYIVGYYAVVAAFILGYVHVPIEFKDTLQTLLGVITTIVVLIANFWFSRQRSSPQANQS